MSHDASHHMKELPVGGAFDIEQWLSARGIVPPHVAPCDADLLGDDSAPAGLRPPAIVALTAPRGRGQLRAAMRRLSPIEQRVLLLRYSGETSRSYASIAAEIGVVKSTAFKAEVRALAKLRRELNELVLDEELHRTPGDAPKNHDEEQDGDRVAGGATSNGDQRAVGPKQSPGDGARTSDD